MDDPAQAPPPAAPARCQPGPVLPGSRWRQDGASGHGHDLLSVVRVSAHSVLVVMEGGGKRRGSAHKTGKRYNIPLDAFLQNHTLVAQPAGYTPGDERHPDRPKTDTLQHYFDRRARARRLQDLVEGRDVRYEVSGDLRDPVPPAPGTFEGVLVAVVLPDPVEEEPAVTSTPSTPHAARHESVSNPVLPREQAERMRQLLAQSAGVEPAPPVPTPDALDVLDAPADAEPVSPYTKVMDANDAPAPETPESAEADPMEQFMESGRVLVEGLNARITSARRTADELRAQADEAQDRVDRLVHQKERIEAAVLAAIEASGEPEPAPVLDPEPEPGGVRAVPSVSGSTRLMGPGGFVADPDKGSQRDWVLDRFAERGGLSVQDVCDEFAAHFGIDRDRAIKSVSSVLSRQVQSPSPKWPTAARTGPGVYTVEVAP
jgi:hypothetical protein